MKVALTGSTGFVGQHLAAYLGHAGLGLLSLDRKALENAHATSFDGCEAVIHLAGKAHDLKKVARPELYDEVNYGLTKKLYDAFLLSEARQFIFFSSVKAAADTVQGLLTEHSKPDPQTAYGQSKLKAEAYLLAQPLPPGKSCHIVRPCMIHGPGNKGNLNLLYQFVKKGIPWPLAAFANKRSFVSIENLCFMVHEMLKQNTLPSGIYNFADDEALSTAQVVSILAATLGQPAKLWPLPKKLITGLAKIGDKLHLPLNTERLTKLTESYQVDNTKIKSALHIKLPLSAREGLALTAKSFRNLNPQ